MTETRIRNFDDLLKFVAEQRKKFAPGVLNGDDFMFSTTEGLSLQRIKIENTSSVGMIVFYFPSIKGDSSVEIGLVSYNSKTKNLNEELVVTHLP